MDFKDICVICKESIDYDRRFPCMLPCGHVICNGCRVKHCNLVTDDQGSKLEKFDCPTCKTEQ